MTVEKIGTGTQRERDAAINANFEALDTGKLDKTSADSDYAKKSTTLSGYGITDAYTKTETDNKISAVVSSLQWKPSVETYADIATTYPNPADGWTVNVNDTDITYRYTGSSWIAISANSIPIATSDTDGKMSAAMAAKLNGISEGANNYTLPAATASVLGGVKIGSNININSDVISVNNASTTQKGVVQLIDSSVTEDYTKAPTAAAMKRTWELASGKQNPETTLSGYGITDAYTKTEVDNKITEAVAGAAVLKTEFTASSANWGTLSDGYYPFTLAASGKHFLGMYRTNGSTYENVMVDVVESGSNIIIQSTEKFAGFILTI
ncbi:head fiber protein [Phascolarctobacterium faecium]|uniref:head fiber protein n=1 Tax=Phascolarctobacterium faecium TaxID=33025 RepID=UPI002665B6F2|nr:head fiber protein [Phascolarctobacterium faecium]